MRSTTKIGIDSNRVVQEMIHAIGYENGMALVALEGGLSTEGEIAAEKDGIIEFVSVVDIVVDAQREDGAESNLRKRQRTS